MKILLWIGIIVIISGSGLFFGAKWMNRGPNTDVANVRVEPATRGDLVETVAAPGEVQPRTMVSISARVVARIVKLPFKEGDTVTKGNPKANPPIPPSVLIELDATDLEAALKSAQARRSAQAAQMRVADRQIEASKARIVAAQATLAEAERDCRRQNELLTSKDVGQAAVDTSQSKVEEQRAQLSAQVATLHGDEANLQVMGHNLEAADADIARAKDSLSYTIITSPIDGTVTRLNAEVGELVVTGTMNNAGTIIMEVADLSQMLLKARVDETTIAGVLVGQKARVRMEAYRDKIFEGKVVSVALANFDASMARGASNRMNSSSDGSRFYKTEILINTEGKRIFSGLNADAEIETTRHTNLIKAPSQAVLGRQLDDLPADLRDRPEVDKTKSIVPVVYRYKDGKAVATPVIIGASDLTHTIIKSGLAEGDLIITGPYKVLESLKHDQKVKDERGAATQPATTSASH